MDLKKSSISQLSVSLTHTHTLLSIKSNRRYYQFDFPLGAGPDNCGEIAKLFCGPCRPRARVQSEHFHETLVDPSRSSQANHLRLPSDHGQQGEYTHHFTLL